MAGQPVTRKREGRPPAPDAGNSPARGYSWEQFKPGHYLSLRHGAHSPRVLDALAEARAADLFEHRPDLREYSFAVSAWARAEALAAVLWWWLDQRGPVDGDGAVREHLLRRQQSAENAAAKHRDALGLGPASRARLERERAEAMGAAFDVGRVIDKGREVLAARGIELAPTQDGAEDDETGDAA